MTLRVGISRVISWAWAATPVVSLMWSECASATAPPSLGAALPLGTRATECASSVPRPLPGVESADVSLLGPLHAERPVRDVLRDHRSRSRPGLLPDPHRRHHHGIR